MLHLMHSILALTLDYSIGTCGPNGALTPIPGSPFPAGYDPRSVAVDPTAKFVYVANFDSNNISAYSIDSNGALTPVSGSPFATGVGPVSVVVNVTGNFAYVVNFGSKSVSAYSIGSSGALTPVSGSPFPTGLGPVSVAIDTGTKFVYVANRGSYNVSGYSVGSDGALAPVPGSPFPAGPGPLSVAVDPMAKFAYVTNFDSNDISAYSIDSNGALRPIPGSPFTARVKPASVVITRLLPFAPLSTMARQKSESAGPQTPVDEAWPVIEPTIKDLAYADKSPDEKLDLYLPAKGSGPAPLVIWIHGGGFIEGDKSSMPRRDFGSSPPPRGTNGISQIQVPNVAALVAKGYAAVSLNYRLGPSFVDGALPATRDGKAAVRFLRANASKYGLDPVGSPFGAIPLEDIWLQYSALPGISPLYSTTPRSVTPGFPAQFKRAWYGSARKIGCLRSGT